MAQKKGDMRFNIQDDEKFIESVDAHIEEYPDDLRSRNDFYKQAARFFLGSRRNKGKFKRIS